MRNGTATDQGRSLARRAWSLPRGASLPLIALLLAICIANTLWIASNQEYVQDEVAVHLDGAADFRNRAWGIFAEHRNPVRLGQELLRLMNSAWGGSQGWPRATYAISAAVSLLTPDAERWPFYSNLVFWAIGLAGFLGVMRRLFPGSRELAVEGALVATALWSLFPGTYGPLRLYGLDFPLACCVMPGLALLMASEGFSRRRASILFGAFAAFAVLVKGQFLLYMAPALAVIAVLAVRDVRSGEGAGARRRLSNLALAALPAALAIWIWLHGAFGEVARLFYVMVFPGAVDPAIDAVRAPPKPFEWYSVAWLTYWFRASVANLGVMGTAALAASPLLLVWRRGRRALGRDGWLLWGTAAGIFVLWTAIPARDMRFVFPFLPLYAALAARSLMALGPLPRVLAVAALLTLGTGLAARLSLDRGYHAVVAQRVHDGLGWDAGNIMARPPSGGPFPDLAGGIDHRLDEIAGDRPGDVALAVVPYADGRSKFDHCNDQAYIETFRVKCRRRCVTSWGNEYFHPRSSGGLGSAKLLDPRFLPTDYFERDDTDPDLLVILHFHTQYEYVQPAAPSWAFEGPMPDLFWARTLEEIAARVPPGYRRTGQIEYEGGSLPPVRVYFFEKPSEPAL